ncbi:MAG: hypothetical protein JNG90_19480 [Planctomycetaceae bacterium]|nr:hypothetical protein [Planctomycetaceae bacterium]
MSNAIGNFEFISLREVPFGLSRQLELIERAGVNGTGIRRTGIRGRPIQLRSHVDTPDTASAIEQLELYRALIGADAVNLIWNDVPSYDAGYAVVVLDVVPVTARGVVSAVGGLLGGGLGRLEADWTLQPVPLS